MTRVRPMTRGLPYDQQHSALSLTGFDHRPSVPSNLPSSGGQAVRSWVPRVPVGGVAGRNGGRYEQDGTLLGIRVFRRMRRRPDYSRECVTEPRASGAAPNHPPVMS